MERLARTEGLTGLQQDILATVRDFVNKEILPVATDLEHKDTYPAQIVEGMRKLGLFGLTIGEEYGRLGAASSRSTASRASPSAGSPRPARAATRA